MEAGLAHGLKKRIGGLLPPQDTQTILEKLARVSEPAAILVQKLSGEEGNNKNDIKASPGKI